MTINTLGKRLPSSLKKILKPIAPKLSLPRGGKPYELKHQYTVVSAVYNMELYLDDYFSCIFNQTCNTTNIRIILVDDGSVDRSPTIIEGWQKRYPNQITYLHQKNAGPGAARNRGLDAVTTEWVTFIDSDDKIEPNYFEEVDKSISNHPSLIMATCRLYYWYMATNKLQKESAIMQHFGKGENLYYAVGDEQMPPAFFMNATFFKTDLIRENHILIDKQLRPNFEDGKFIAYYLLSANSGTVGFLDRAHYLYRKRADQSSIIDNSWEDPRKYLLVTKQGYLDVLKFALEQKGHVPLNIQQTILQDLSWFFKELENQPAHCKKIGTPEEQELFLDILDEIFNFITVDALFSMNSEFLAFRRKVGIARTFMKDDPPFMLCKLRKLDVNKRRLLIETYDPNVAFFFDGIKTEPFERKRADINLCGRLFYHRYEVWLEYPEGAQIFSYRLPSGKEVRLDVREKKTFRRSVGMKGLVKRYTKDWGRYPQENDSWLFLDRDTRADDNAEHLYRYVMKNHPDRRIAFALQRTSPDWDRLEKEGFNLVDFGSREFEREATGASTIISSQGDDYAYSYFGDNYFDSKNFVFLQHGITMNDLSLWLNTFTPSLMLASTPQEADFLTADGGSFLYTPRQIALTGLPRHDRLLGKRKAHNASLERSTLLILPTWRRYLSGDRIGAGCAMNLVPAFEDSLYKRAWEGILSSPELKKVAAENDLKIVFYPHPHFLPYIDARKMSVPAYVEIGSPNNRSFQDYVAEAAICVTDYSSASLDASLAGVPVVYYQFDKDEFFSGDHGLEPGYFEFERDGFGPVASTKEECLKAIEAIVSQGFEMAPEYAERAAKTFTMADGHCCERAYEAIENL